MDDFDDDTHFCLKCHNTIIGLENYVNHRKDNCLKQEVGQKSSIPAQLLSTDEAFALKADDFFSSLELQSSSKKIIQSSTSGKVSSGVLTRSKITASTRELAEPSKSGKNAWIGGHQLKELEAGDNQSKLIKAVANLERRKDDLLVRDKEITRLGVFEETDDDSEESEYDEETSDEDAPPRNHTGGKWKPSSPIYWKGLQSEDWITPPPNFTGGKWKPAPSKSTECPLSNQMKNKWRTDNSFIKENDDFPPPSFTGSKWSQTKKLEFCTPPVDSKSEFCTNWDDNNYPPPEHTKGKWKPENSSDSLDILTTYSEDKWIPSLKYSDKKSNTRQVDDSPFRKSGGTVQYWCKACDRRLASKIVYERHLKSEFHFKRTLRDNEFEDANLVGRAKRKVTDKKIKFESTVVNRKRLRRKTFEKCQVCYSKVNIKTMGKHLISHYHCRKGDLSSDSSKQMVLNYIHSIVMQSPFQCRCCNFYFNFHKDFLNHWTSEYHLNIIKEKSGYFLCSYCKFSCETNDDMFEHLTSEGHREVVLAINRSVPIVIKRVNYRECGFCGESFLLNIQLMQHIQKTGHVANDESPKNYHKCSICQCAFSSKVALQRHKRIKHKERTFICGTCDLTFSNAEEAALHRNTEQHTYAALEKKNADNRTVLQKKCQYCCKIFANFLELKNHIRIDHIEFHSSCPQCGLAFVVPQELTVHLRTKSCKFNNHSPKKYTCEKCTFSSDSTAQFLFHKALHEVAIRMNNEISTHSSSKKPTLYYKCSICDKMFPKSSLESHLRIHTEERPYSCSYCKATFVRKSNWIYHEKKHTSEKLQVKSKTTSESGSPFLCSTCGASFKKRFVLQQHMKIHTGKLFKCVEKDCVFAGRSFGELKHHYQIHFDEKNFKCSKCDYKGKTKQQLMRHMTIHDGEKKFKCTFCSFTARTSHHLKRHTLIHTGTKPYSCPHCSYSCNSLENLRKHILSTNKHPGKSIYECKYCTEKVFQTNFFKEFKTHLLVVHSDEMSGESIHESIIHEANRESFLSSGKTNKSIGKSETIGENTSSEETIKIEVPADTHILASGDKSRQVPLSHGEDVLPLISLIVAREGSICEETNAENWSLVGCYDVEESGTLVPFTKEGNGNVFF